MGEVPDTIDFALTYKWPQPSKIEIKKDGKFWRILGVEFNKTEPVIETTDFYDAQEVPF